MTEIREFPKIKITVEDVNLGEEFWVCDIKYIRVHVRQPSSTKVKHYWGLAIDNCVYPFQANEVCYVNRILMTDCRIWARETNKQKML